MPNASRRQRFLFRVCMRKLWWLRDDPNCIRDAEQKPNYKRAIAERMPSFRRLFSNWKYRHFMKWIVHDIAMHIVILFSLNSKLKCKVKTSNIHDFLLTDNWNKIQVYPDIRSTHCSVNNSATLQHDRSLSFCTIGKHFRANYLASHSATLDKILRLNRNT